MQVSGVKMHEIASMGEPRRLVIQRERERTRSPFLAQKHWDWVVPGPVCRSRAPIRGAAAHLANFGDLCREHSSISGLSSPC